MNASSSPAHVQIALLTPPVGEMPPSTALNAQAGSVDLWGIHTDESPALISSAYGFASIEEVDVLIVMQGELRCEFDSPFSVKRSPLTAKVR